MLERLTWAPERGPLLLRGLVASSRSEEVVEHVRVIALVLRLVRQGIVSPEEARSMLIHLC